MLNGGLSKHHANSPFGDYSAVARFLDLGNAACGFHHVDGCCGTSRSWWALPVGMLTRWCGVRSTVSAPCSWTFAAGLRSGPRPPAGDLSPRNCHGLSPGAIAGTGQSLLPRTTYGSRYRRAVGSNMLSAIVGCRGSRWRGVRSGASRDPKYSKRLIPSRRIGRNG